MSRHFIILFIYIISSSSLTGGHQVSDGPSMFEDITQNLFRDGGNNPIQLNYGVAITDVDNDGDFEIVVAGFNGPNLVLKYDHDLGRLYNLAVDDPNSPYYGLRDPKGQAIGVCACDIDGDGREEIYFLNTNQAYSGMATYSDKLFKFRNGAYVDLLSDDVNKNIASFFAGRSVACVDRKGNGKYSVYLANYARGNVGPHALIEMDESKSNIPQGIIALKNVGSDVGIAKLTGGRGVTVGPILNKEGYSDIFCVNEHGPNFLFKNNGDGTFTDVASETGVGDAMEHGRGLALTDFNGDGLVDIVYGNWNGPHRLFLQERKNNRTTFKNIATSEFSEPSPIRTVIAADFLNNANIEVLFNNIAYRGAAPNRVFSVLRGDGNELNIVEKNIGDALEPTGRGTGGAVTDFDGDGFLELILSHGESAEQPLSVYRIPSNDFNRSNKWLRVRPLTRQGAPARGARVTLFSRALGRQTRIIDGGSGYLCQMEPVAHFGLGEDSPLRLEVTWPDAKFSAIDLSVDSVNKEIRVNHPDVEGTSTANTQFRTSQV